MAQQNNTGKLLLIPNTLGDTAPFEVLPISIKRAIEGIDHYIVENEKSARQFIKKVSPRKSQPNLKIWVLNKYTEPQELPEFLKPCLAGKDMGVLSEAGCPAIADPGANIVALAHSSGIRVVPLVGPSSILLAMMASGLNGQNFAFNGYLPIEQTDRKKAIKKLERLSRETEQSQILIETPYRNDKMFTELIRSLNAETRLCVAVDLTLPTEMIRTLTAAQWQNMEAPDLHKRPAIFIFQG